MTVLRARGLRVGADAFDVVLDGSLELCAGEVVAVVGPNGAGKTTLALALAGLVAVDAGEVWTSGPVAYLPQHPVLFAGTVLRNVTLPLRLAGVARPEREARALDALATFGADDLAGRRVNTLSGGELRRVALARLTLQEAAVAVLDEPFGGLDAAVRDDLLRQAVPIVRDPGRASVVVTHHRDEAVALADRVVVVVAGRVRQQGPIAEVFARPADTDVARVVGAENVLVGTVEADRDGIVTVRTSSGLVLEAVGEAVRGDAVVVVFRPDGVVVHPRDAATDDSARNHIAGVVEALEPRDHVVRVVAAAGGERIVATVVPATVEAMGLRAGSAVTLAVKATGVHAVRRG